MAKRTKNFPFAHAWFGRDLRRLEGWEFGFYFAPCPGREHAIGDMVKALFMLDGCICFKPWKFRIWLWSFDPANRPIGEQ